MVNRAAGREHLKGLAALEMLFVPKAGVTEAAIEGLEKALPNLHVYR